MSQFVPQAQTMSICVFFVADVDQHLFEAKFPKFDWDRSTSSDSLIQKTTNLILDQKEVIFPNMEEQTRHIIWNLMPICQLITNLIKTCRKLLEGKTLKASSCDFLCFFVILNVFAL